MKDGPNLVITMFEVARNYCWLARVSLLITSEGAHSFLGHGEEPLAVL